MLTPVPPPRLVFWETTAGCNLRCLHCRRLDVLDAPSSDDLSSAEARRLIDDISAHYKPILVLSGGEPLMRPDILDLARHARESGLRVALATNGTLVTAEKAAAIRQAGVARVSVSLDGARPETHDRLRGAGNFERALQGLRNLRAWKVPVQVNMTVTRHNAEELPDLYRLCLNLGADALHLFMLVPVGCGVKLADSDMLPADDYEKWLHWMYDREREERLELKATCAPHYFRVVRQRGKADGGLPPSHRRQETKGAAAGPPSLHQTTKGCLAGSGVCFVSHAGDVFPCGYLPVQAGNVREISFKDIWESSPVFAQLRNPDLLGGKCGACSFRFVCGGCRARAYYESDDYLAEEPFCVYTPPAVPAAR
jgi:heme b synthase